MGAMVPWWVPLGVVVLAATALAYALGVAGIGLMGERLSSFVSLSEVLFAALIAAVVLGEIPSPIQILGGALIVAGVVLIRFASGERRRAADLRRGARGPGLRAGHDTQGARSLTA